MGIRSALANIKCRIRIVFIAQLFYRHYLGSALTIVSLVLVIYGIVFSFDRIIIVLEVVKGGFRDSCPFNISVVLKVGWLNTFTVIWFGITVS